MRRGTAALIVLASLAACRPESNDPEPRRDAAASTLSAEEKIVRATLTLLASDGKHVCVAPQTFGSPLSIWHIATQGKLQNTYDLAWSAPEPFRPPPQPTLRDLRRAVRTNNHAKLAEPEVRKDLLPAAAQAKLQAQASALAPPSVPTRRVAIRTEWLPNGARLRWWPNGSTDGGCDAQYVLSGIKGNAHVAFIAVRVEHWGTVFALAPRGGDWRPIARWGTWLY